MSEAANQVIHGLLHTTEGRTNPYPSYHWLRALAPVHRNQHGVWFLTRHADCAAALRDPRFGKDYERQTEVRAGPDWRRHPALENGRRSMVHLDGPAHARLRRPVVKAFTPRTVAALRPKIEAMVDQMLDSLAATGGGDVFDTLAFPLPVNVIGELLGVPAGDRPQFRHWVRDVTAIFEPNLMELLDAADRASLAIRGYFRELLEEKRKHPADDLLSRLVIQEREDSLTNDELCTLASGLFAAGFETTTNLIGNGLFGLLEHPGEMKRLWREPALHATLADELLRYDGTAQLATRFMKADVEVGGKAIPEGETVVILLGAANHDPARYDDPDRLDVGRTNVEPLSFGGGIHYCLGAALAEAEIEIVFRKLFERFATIDLAGFRPRFRDRLALRGLESLQIVCRTEADARPTASALNRTLGLRPKAAGGADAEWRNALRAKVEKDAAGVGHPSATHLETIVLLARTPLFRRCTAEELRELASTAYPVSFDPGDKLCEEGGESLECYVIAEGEATVTIGGETVGSVHEDDVVGERGPLEGRARSATVTADSRITTWAISRERLVSLVERSPRAKAGMFDYLKLRYAEPRSASQRLREPQA